MKVIAKHFEFNNSALKLQCYKVPPVIKALHGGLYEDAKALITTGADIQPVIYAIESEELMEFVLTQAVQVSNNSLQSLPLSLALDDKWEKLDYILQDRFVAKFELNYENASGKTLPATVIVITK